MGSLVCPNVARLVALYATLGRAASMTFDWEIVAGHAPSAEDVYALDYNYRQWQYAGAVPVLGFLQSDACYFLGCNVWSLDPRSAAAYRSRPDNVFGAIPSIESGPLPTTVAPIVNWGVRDITRQYRTYVCGLSERATDSGERGDTSRLSDLYVDALTTGFGDLLTFMADNGAQLVKLETRRAGAVLSPAVPHTVVGVGVNNRIAGNQRRRTNRTIVR